MDYVLHSSTVEADAINRLHGYFYWAAGFILLLVVAATVYITWKFRSKPGQQYTAQHLDTRWEYLLVGLPLCLVIGFFLLMTGTMHEVAADTDGRTPDVVITGHQYWWEVQYPAKQVTTANEVHLPAGRRLLVKLLSADVIHDWWVPQFGSKMDMISGQENYLWITIREPGTYGGACSEFCGAQHAGMHIIVVAQKEPDFDHWLNGQRASPAAVHDSMVQRGADLFRQKTCGNCHQVNGSGRGINAGPDLTHLAGRQTLLTGLLVNNRENLRRWIRDPQSIKPGANMPAYRLDEKSLDALTAYLTSLQ